MASNNTTIVRCVRLPVPTVLIENNGTRNYSDRGHFPDDMFTEWSEFVIPIISFLGVLGNVLNLVVLTKRRLLSTMDTLEKSATFGLAALALSDMMVCLSVLPLAFISNKTYSYDNGHLFGLYYKVYGIALINLFIMTSTWLIMVLALSRYLVVVHPLKARYTVTVTRTIWAIVVTYICSLCVSLPYFMHLRIIDCYDPEGTHVKEIRDIGNKDMRGDLLFYNRWIWPVLAYFIPLTILVFCNARLVCELRKAKLFRRNSCHYRNIQERHERVTLTLVIIVLMLLVLVAPSEIIKYIDPFGSWGYVGYVVASVTNVLQAVNFAVNFILYCVVNRHFRQAICDIMCGCVRKSPDDANTYETSPLNGKVQMEQKPKTAKNVVSINGCETYL